MSLICNFRFRGSLPGDPPETAIVLETRGDVQKTDGIWAIAGCWDFQPLGRAILAIMAILRVETHGAAGDKVAKFTSLHDESWVKIARPDEQQFMPQDAVCGFVAMCHEPPDRGTITVVFSRNTALELLSELIRRMGYAEAQVCSEGLTLIP